MGSLGISATTELHLAIAPEAPELRPTRRLLLACPGPGDDKATGEGSGEVTGCLWAVLYDTGDRKRDPNFENYPCVGLAWKSMIIPSKRGANMLLAQNHCAIVGLSAQPCHTHEPHTPKRLPKKNMPKEANAISERRWALKQDTPPPIYTTEIPANLESKSFQALQCRHIDVFFSKTASLLRDQQAVAWSSQERHNPPI